jgi:hypothetical protein
MSFDFIDNPKRESTPLLVGLIGPSGSGKTYSALRLATGIQRVRGGKLVGIDTEARRMLHYANEFPMTYLEFGAPFGSLRYLEAIKAAAAKAEGGVVVVDSRSHEHEGEGGYLEYHEAELDRMAGQDWKKREKMTFTAWIKPAGERRRLIDSILQLNCAFIFCFRAKEKLKLVKGQDPIQLGWQAIAGEEFAFEMTVRCLLPPGANGVPDWTEEAFKNGVPKRGKDHIALVPDGQQLNELVGERLARWAKGEPEQSLEDALHDIENAPNLEGLRFKHVAAFKAFPDPESRAKIDAAKDKRKAELSKAAEAGAA